MADTTTYRNALPLQSLLLEYRLESVLGAGGFGMTYLGRDTHLEKLVAIKEYLPTDFAVRALDGSIVPISTDLQHDYQWGLERFTQEARTLAKFSHSHIVRVNRYFEANGTGYMVMDYEKGETLHQMLRRGLRPDEAKLKGMLVPLLDGLQAVHAAGFLHRDIKPGNIVMRERGGPVLIDFGAARLAIGGATRSLTSVLTPGYAPLEQYASDGNQGPWSDLYALAGVLYRVLVNENPPDAVSRLKGDAVPGKLALARGRVSETFLRAIAWALALDEKQRPQDVEEWRRALEGRSAVSVAAGVMPTLPSNSDEATVPNTQSAFAAGRAAPRPPGRSRSGWRWLGTAALLLVAILVFGAWNNQRSVRTAAPETAPSSPAARAPGSGLNPATGVQPSAGPGETLRARPERERTDRPGDQLRLNLEEYRAKVEQEFLTADRNGDGYLSQEEVRGRFAFIQREFERVDRNADGRISPDEFWQLRRMQAEQRFRKQ